MLKKSLHLWNKRKRNTEICQTLLFIIFVLRKNCFTRASPVWCYYDLKDCGKVSTKSSVLQPSCFTWHVGKWKKHKKHWEKSHSRTQGSPQTKASQATRAFPLPVPNCCSTKLLCVTLPTIFIHLSMKIYQAY